MLTGSRSSAIVPLILVGIVALMVVPLPPFLLDLLLAASIALSLGLLLVAIHLERPLDLSIFPTLVLFGTLLRLSLNVATTRLILLHGGEGAEAAGAIIRAFGEFVVGGNYVVGATIFVLLVVINFVVITKGAGRVAEVSARFTLDAMPGKQMSIDADLAAGAITQDQARARRKEVEHESDFFGAMDGASKFVRGDAIAGLVMTGINIVVGFIVGVVQNGLEPARAASTYTILTVGDGLASQIPGLLMSTAAAVVVTRASAGGTIAQALVSQLGRSSTALYTTAGLVGAMGFVPGMPFVPFAALGGLLFFAARAAASAEAGPAKPETPAAEPPSEREQIEQMMHLDLLALEVGYDLVSLVEAGGALLERIGAIRKNLALELGVIVPPLQIRDNLQLRPGQYRVLLSDTPIATGELRPTRWLAMDPTGSLPDIGGEKTTEPAFGLPARWIAGHERDRAEALGYTVVDPATVAATHLTEALRQHAHELLGRSEAQELLDLFAKREPRLVDEVVPNVLHIGEVIQVLRSLLGEGVPVRDLRTILEALADHGRTVKDPAQLADLVRERLSRHITSKFRDGEGRVAALVLDPRLEEAFRKGLDAGAAQRLLSSLDQSARAFAQVSTPPALVCAPDVRRTVAQFLARRVPGLSVLSYREIDPKTTVRSLGIVAAS
ncbi:MAG: flagellar biosynthesis protein FlhA [Sandaracinaceae bacterium]|nr:flagellar biosynthesis protein FlhA [Sandaracinaceae bacterium]